MDKINISGIKVMACHGVLPYEKTTPQPFIFDVEMGLDFYPAIKHDDLDKTVNYAEVCELIEDIAKAKSYELIECLAYSCALRIMIKYAIVKDIKVTVSKPKAPVSVDFKNISVTAELSRQSVILSFGSSIGDGEKLIRAAINKLDDTVGIKVKKVSSYIKTAPYGGVAQNEFTNCAAEVECLLTPFQLLDIIHQIEGAAGRVRKERWGDRTLDIDIVFFGDKIIRQRGLSIPHPDYANRDFVLTPIKEIAPDFVCPLTGKRMSDM